MKNERARDSSPPSLLWPSLELSAERIAKVDAYVNPPPDWFPGEGVEFFLPDVQIAVDIAPDDVMRAAHTVALVVARWGDRFEAYELGRRGEARSGPLLGSLTERERLINQAWKWLGTLRGLPWLLALNIWRGEAPLLEQHDGIPGVLVLSRAEFAFVQAALRECSLPADLYYPAIDQRVGTEYQEKDGGVVLVERRYTPSQWARRNQRSEHLTPPTEEERRSRFVEETELYVQHVNRRVLELREPGRTPSPETLARMAALRSLLLDVLRRDFVSPEEP